MGSMSTKQHSISDRAPYKGRTGQGDGFNEQDAVGNVKEVREDFVNSEGVFLRNENIVKQTIPTGETPGYGIMYFPGSVQDESGHPHHLGRLYLRAAIAGPPSLKTQTTTNFFKTTLGEQKET